MASKSPRAKPSSSGQQPAVENQPQVSSTERSQRQATSPGSQQLVTRLEEKKTLQTLNDRLANYIDTVRRLEVENQHLTTRVTTLQETSTREVHGIKAIYEKEIEESRRLLDSTATEKAKLQIEANRFKADNTDLNNRLNKREKEIGSLEKKLDTAEREVRDLSKKVSDLQNQKARSEEVKATALKELEDKKQELNVARTQLEQETLARVSLENELTTARENLVFEQSVYQEQLNQSELNYKSEIEETVSGQLQQQYEQRLADELQELRADTEAQWEQNRRDLEVKYDDQLKSLQARLDQRSGADSKTRSEMQALKTKNETLLSKSKEFEAIKTSLTQRIKDLEQLIEQERTWHEKALDEKERELAELRQKLTDHAKEYQALLDIKIALDIEINTYRKLLEGEESRLSIGSVEGGIRTPSRVVSPRPIRSATKRKVVFEEQYETNIEVDSNSNGDIEVRDHDAGGKNVVIFNKGAEEKSVGGWHIELTAGNDVTTYKFPRNTVIKPATIITVWSADTKHTHNPPTDLLMKGQNWAHGDDMVARLVDSDGAEQAHRETKKTLRATKRRQATGGDEESRCCVM